MPLDSNRDLFIPVGGKNPGQPVHQQDVVRAVAVTIPSPNTTKAISTPESTATIINLTPASPGPGDHVIRRVKKAYTLRPAVDAEEKEDSPSPPHVVAKTNPIPIECPASSKSQSTPTPIPCLKRAGPSIGSVSLPSSTDTIDTTVSTTTTADPSPSLSPLKRALPTIDPDSHLSSTTKTGTRTSALPSSTQVSRQSSTTTNNTQARTSTTSSRFSTSASTSRGSTPDLHYFESCQHTSPPHNRPLNAQPHYTTNPAYNPLHPTSSTLPQFLSTIPGSCHACDSACRRDLESSILSAYAHVLGPKQEELAGMRRKLASGAAARGEIELLKRELGLLQDQEDREVTGVWRGYAARWGPGAIGVDRRELGGRMKVSWIRPERGAGKEDGKGKKRDQGP